MVKVADGSDNGSQPASGPALPRPASPVPDTFGHDSRVGTHDSAHPPRYGPAVLRALAAPYNACSRLIDGLLLHVVRWAVPRICRVLGHDWNIHSFPLPDYYGQSVPVTHTHCRRCGDPGPVTTWTRGAR